jgi:catechol 2,3-dioxygenase-like lactoylglutathione lyase family enzyme
MLDHVGIFVSETARSFSFYESTLAPLGIVVRERQRQWGSIVMSGEPWRPFLWIGPAGGTYYGTEVKVSDRRPMHLAFRAPSKASVEEFHRIGLTCGGRDNGAPADCGNGAYGAYLLDPDGNNVEAIYREP